MYQSEIVYPCSSNSSIIFLDDLIGDLKSNNVGVASIYTNFEFNSFFLFYAICSAGKVNGCWYREV
jgi:hypothetical protein